MSTRCNIHFNGYGRTVANIYRHSDGYPKGVLPDLQRFFEAVEAQTSDTRYSDPSYLAAKFVVWQAGEYAVEYDFSGGETKVSPAPPLKFLSLGIVNEDAGDGEYVYTVNCDKFDKKGRPKVSHRTA